MLTLYHNDMSTCSQKVRFVLATKGLDWSGVELDLRGGDQQQPDFLKLNPKGVVPVLVDEDAVYTESNLIMSYLEDAHPQPTLMPTSARDKTLVRAWMQRLDTGLHLHIAALSFAIAFRLQLLKIHHTQEKLEAYFNNIRDPNMLAFYRDVVPNGVNAAPFRAALLAYDKLLEEMEEALDGCEWLVGNEPTLADAAYAPYITRLDHLALERLWAKRPRVSQWYARLQQNAAYKKGISDWFNPAYFPLMRDAGRAEESRIAEILAERISIQPTVLHKA